MSCLLAYNKQVVNGRDWLSKQISNPAWITEGGVIKPAYLKITKRKPSKSGFAIYIPHSEIFGYTISEEKLITIIKNMKVSDVVSSASKLLVTLENHGHFNRDIHAGLVVHLFPKDVARKINYKLFVEPDRLLFHEHQLLNVVKLGLMYGSFSRRKDFRNKEVFDRYLKNVVLGISDHLENQYRLTSASHPTSREEKTERMIEMAVRNMYFNVHEKYKYLIGRYYQLLFEIPERKKLQSSHNYINLKSLTKKFTSYSLEQHYALGFAVLAQYVLANIHKGKLDPNHFFINKTQFFKEIIIPHNRSVQFLNRMSVTAKQFRKEFPKELKNTKNFYYSFILLHQKPLAKVNDFLYFVASPKLLKERITSGIFWEIADNLDKDDTDKLFRFFGELFEEYCKDMFKRMYKPNKKLSDRCFFEKPYSATVQKRTTDIMVCYGKEAIFIEVKASRLKMIETAIMGNIKSFREDLDKFVYKAAKQLDRNIKDFRNGDFTLGKYNARNTKTIIPVILALFPIPQVDIIWLHEIEIRLKKEGWFKGLNVGKLQIIDIEEMEMIEALMENGYSFLDILKDRENSYDMIYKPMKNFLLRNYFRKDKKYHRNTHLHHKYEEASKMIRMELFGKLK